MSDNQITCFWVFAVSPVANLKPLMFPEPGAKPAEWPDYLNFIVVSLFGGILLILFYTFLGYLWFNIKRYVKKRYSENGDNQESTS